MWSTVCAFSRYMCVLLIIYLKQCSLGRSLSVVASFFTPWSPIQFSDRLETRKTEHTLGSTHMLYINISLCCTGWERTHLSISREESETKASANFSAPLSPILLFHRLKEERDRKSYCHTRETNTYVERDRCTERELEEKVCIFTLSAADYVDLEGAPTAWEEPGDLSLDQA